MRIIAIIPTYNRPTDFLRALDSISSQTHPPDHVIIVHEEEDLYPLSLSDDNIHVTINRRTKSLSGAINHAVDEIIVNRHDWGIEPEYTWLALLDDDDWWDPTYLEKCISLADGQCHQVVSGLIRYDRSEPGGFNLSIPDYLDCSSFLTSNPHIQGSNLFVRLDSFLGAGGFDESILSCTDRDFCIRLFECRNHQWKRLDEHLVHHDARKVGRISDPNSERKRQGITRFAMKHQFRMNNREWHDFLDVSESRFGIKPSTFQRTENPQIETGPMKKKSLPVLNKQTGYDLTIGVTFSHIDLVKQFTSSLQGIISEWPHRVRLVACLHGIETDEIIPILNNLDERDLELVIYDENSAMKLASDGSLGPWFEREEGRSGVSWGRCVLHRRLLDEIGDDKRPVIWVVDEDMLLQMSEAGDNEKVGTGALIETISMMGESGIDVGIGHVIGDPPIHPLFTLRTQLLDLYYSELSETGLGEIRIKWLAENPHDIHHDLSTSRFDHIEFPWGMFNIGRGYKDALKSIHNGRFSSRPVHSDWQRRTNADLISRGGNTIILDPNVLGEWSNVAPLIADIQTRRGDSFWSLYAQRISGKSIVGENRKVSWIPFAVPQARTNTPVNKYDIDNLRGDIIGSMIMRELSNTFPLDSMRENRDLWDRGGWEKKLAENATGESKLRESRLISSLYRANKLGVFLESETSYFEIASHLFRTEMPPEIESEIEIFFQELPQSTSLFHSAQPKIRLRYRLVEAIEVLKGYGDFVDAELHGDGSEGVVFRKGEKAIKIHHNGLLLEEENIALISGLTGQSIDCLPKNFTLLNNYNPVIVSYNWVEGNHPDFQTSARPWLNLLRECREREFVYWDLKPLNLIMTSENKLVIIDLGRDLKPFNKKDWDSMVRKAYLCWKHWDKPNLRALLTKSVRVSDTNDFPELNGIEMFRDAIDIQDKSDLHDPWFLDLIRTNYSGRILDWGCGSGGLTRKIADLGFEIDAYDPIVEHKEKVTSHSLVNWINGPGETQEGAYPVVISNLVLCDIVSDKEVLDVLRIISRSLTPSGKAIVTVCHPDSLPVTCTSTILRPEVVLVDGKVSYNKTVRSTGRTRFEHTRSQDLIEELASSAGLKLTGVFHSPGINVNDCTPASEYLGLEFSIL